MKRSLDSGRSCHGRHYGLTTRLEWSCGERASVSRVASLSKKWIPEVIVARLRRLCRSTLIGSPHLIPVSQSVREV